MLEEDIDREEEGGSLSRAKKSIKLKFDFNSRLPSVLSILLTHPSLTFSLETCNRGHCSLHRQSRCLLIATTISRAGCSSSREERRRRRRRRRRARAKSEYMPQKSGCLSQLLTIRSNLPFGLYRKKSKSSSHATSSSNYKANSSSSSKAQETDEEALRRLIKKQTDGEDEGDHHRSSSTASGKSRRRDEDDDTAPSGRRMTEAEKRFAEVQKKRVSLVCVSSR